MARSAAKSDRMVCRGCKLPIGGRDGKAAVWLAIGPLHAACHAKLRAGVDATIAAALAAGTHTTDPVLHVCRGCEQWKRIWFVALDGAELCFECTPEGNR